jgi:hypothetical protein
VTFDKPKWSFFPRVAMLLTWLSALNLDSGTLECDRALRKSLESLQAWRRIHNGTYPERLAALSARGLMPLQQAFCPSVRLEAAKADARHSMATSRRPGGDPEGVYEYELTPKDRKSVTEELYTAIGTPPYTRRDIKLELLRRTHADQVPLLRCSSHGPDAPAEFRSQGGIRNATYTGHVYWSGGYWETEWLSDVPYCERDSIVLFGLKGPPFYVDKAPALPTALDLRRWSSAFGDHPWWWTVPLFAPRPRSQLAPHLRSFFEEQHGRIIRVGVENYWINGLTQLQGQISNNEADLYHQAVRQSFVWQRSNLAINKKFQRASWLQGTLWTAAVNDVAGWLIWHYSNNHTERVPLVYGKTTARFWGDLDQISFEKDFPKPVWTHHESAQQVGKERCLRIYEQSWENPHPDVPVTTLEFMSNSNSPAAPFIISINVYP